MVLNILAVVQSSMWRETDAFAFLVQRLQKQEGEKTLSLGAGEGGLITGEVSNWHIFESVPVVRRFLFVCLTLEGFTLNIHGLQRK